MKLSVIITAYDKHNVTIAHMRESMNTSVLPYEMVIVNDGGDPSLKEMIEKMPRKCKVVYSRINEDIPWNYNGACNLAVWLSNGDYLMFEDNDNIPFKTTYEDMLKYMEENPKTRKIRGTKRMEIEQQDLDKPSEEWVQRGTRGPNEGTYMIERKVYLDLKGQDERFCGRYGWMFYDWKSRLTRATEASAKGFFWYVRDAQSNLDRKMRDKNRRFYLENARLKRKQHPLGILNFTYETTYYDKT